jgi:hypothetical protein
MGAFLRKLFRFAPPELGHAELFLGRLLLVLVICGEDFIPVLGQIGLPGFFFDIDHDVQRVPNALANFIDLTFLSDPGVWIAVKWIFGVACLCYVAGILPVLSVGWILLVMVGYGTLRNSQGNIHHGTQLISLFVLGQFIGYAYRFVVDEGRQRTLPVAFAHREPHQTAVFYGMQLAVATYIVAGIWKVHRSGFFGWIADVPNLAVQVKKIGLQTYYADGNPAALEHADKMVHWLTAYPWLTSLLIGSGLIFELAAFLALFNRTLCALIGISLYVMHWIIRYVMGLEFGLNEWVLLIFFVNVPFVVAYVFDRKAD